LPSLLDVFAQGDMFVIICSHLGFCCSASFSRGVIFGLCALEFLFVGIGGGMVCGLFLHHSFGRHWIIDDSVQILLSLIAAFCLIASRWMSSGGTAVSIPNAYIGEVWKAAFISLSALFCIVISVLICDIFPNVQTRVA
jgi:hypothetical protein